MHVTFEDDEFYKRKFKVKDFSIMVHKMSDKEIEECEHQRRSSRPRNGISRYSQSPETTETRNVTKSPRRKLNVSRSPSSTRKIANTDYDCMYAGTKQNDSGKQFEIQECQVSLTRINDASNQDSNNAKRKLAFVFEYLTFCFLLKIFFSIVIAILVLYFL